MLPNRYGAAMEASRGRETKTTRLRSKTAAAMTSTIVGLQVIKDDVDDILQGSRRAALRQEACTVGQEGREEVILMLLPVQPGSDYRRQFLGIRFASHTRRNSRDSPFFNLKHAHSTRFKKRAEHHTRLDVY